MNSFHQLLAQHIEQKHTTVYTLAKNAGLERSYVQKMKTGSRIPCDKKIVMDLAQALSLTPDETNTLIKAYHISKMGADAFYRRRYVADIISAFGNLSHKTELIVNSSTKSSISMPTNLEYIHGTTEVNRILKAVLEIEAANPMGCIKTIAQPAYEYLYNCLATLPDTVKLQNILSFYETNGNSNILYNLDMVKKLVPLFFSCKAFRPVYVHEHVSSVYNESSFLPYKIITSDYVLAISYDTTFAFLSNNDSLINMYRQLFDKKLLSSKPLFQIICAAPENYFASTAGMMEFNNEPHYSYMYQPCLMPFIPLEMVADALNTDIIPPKVQAEIQSYMSKLVSMTNVLHTVFAKDGIEEFMSSGKIIEVPEFMIKARPSKRFRLATLKNIIAAIEKGTLKARIARPNILDIPKPIAFTVVSPSHIVAHFFDDNGEIYLSVLEEISLLHAFYDFITYIQNSDEVYSEEETLEMLKDIYKKYEQKWLR